MFPPGGGGRQDDRPEEPGESSQSSGQGTTLLPQPTALPAGERLTVPAGTDEQAAIAEAAELVGKFSDEYGVQVASGLAASAVVETNPGADAKTLERVAVRKWSIGELRGLYKALAHYAPILGRRRAESSRAGHDQEVTMVGAVTFGLERKKRDLTMAGEYIGSHKVFNVCAPVLLAKGFGGGEREIEGTATHELAHGLLKYALPTFTERFGTWTADGKPKLADGVEPPRGDAKSPKADFEASVKSFLLRPEAFAVEGHRGTPLPWSR
ncbi:hypothetical protein [Streptomyces sp. BK340]|uniref:hypothetical protein n=1 Tax=Streptomyces sp. BK340 TaxID=2572903 RepID=UPI0011A5EC1B|nr:hypothetical protein [Streptomyces sp. BK340]TVZ76722.1 hypothetical protein FB157_1422 [Streptomyces sp. BK340]